MTSAGLGGRFWRLFAASATSNLADGIGRAALPLLAATLTRDPLLISGLYSLAFLPWLMFALPAGSLVDRSDRRRAMLLANSLRAAAVAGLAVATLTGHASIALLYLTAFIIGTAETVYDSAANALLPQVVRPGQLDRGNSLLVTGEAVGQVFLGGPVGALLFTLAAAAPLFTNAAGFAVSALIMVTLAGTYRPARASTKSLRADIGEGVRWMLRHPLLRGLALTYGLTSALQSMVNAVLVLYALEVLRIGETGFGLLLLAGGVGGLLGGLVAPAVGAWLGRTGTLVLVSVCAPLGVIGMGFVHHAAVAGPLFGVTALLVMAGNVLTMSLRQAVIPEELFGRVQGAWRTLVWGGIPIGGVAGGALAAATDVSTVFVVAGTTNLLVGLTVAALLHRHRSTIRDAFRTPADQPGQLIPS
ncbi:MFS transporter [Dactylosporangium sp. NPDC050688]|uniref:MFS transporter n=1 Tax=Dactylosporangium sp. NPDC050688 TaxID=3157217 RepID=UPI00340A6700